MMTVIKDKYLSVLTAGSVSMTKVRFDDNFDCTIMPVSLQRCKGESEASLRHEYENIYSCSVNRKMAPIEQKKDVHA